MFYTAFFKFKVLHADFECLQNMKLLETLNLGNLLWAHIFRRPNVTLQIRYMSKSLKMNETKQRQRNTLDNLQAILS